MKCQDIQIFFAKRDAHAEQNGMHQLMRNDIL